MMLYCIRDIKNRILLFCFGISFFVFLLGRDGLEQLFKHPIVTPFSPDINSHTYFSIIISLLGIWIIYSIYNAKYCKIYKTINLNQRESVYFKYIRKYSKFVFKLILPIGILVNIVIAVYVIRFGYYSSFTELREIIDNSPIFYTINKLLLLLPSSFAIYMSTLPSKSEFKKVAIPYFIYLVISLACGARSTFILGSLLILIFMVYMQKIQSNIVWIDKKYIKVLIFLMPLLAIGLTFYKNIRFGENTEVISLWDSFNSFFYDQGVSSNSIKRAYEYEDDIPKQDAIYSLEFLYSGIPARLMGRKVYQGNNIEHATKGGSFTHALGYTVMGKLYLNGAGTGSSYIAELYYDFGYIGVFIGSCIYGYIFSLINNFKSGGLLRRCMLFMIITDLLWSPRASYSGFVSFLVAPTTIALLIFIFFMAKRSVSKLKEKYDENINYREGYS